MIVIETDADQAFQLLERSLSRVAALGRRTGSELVRRAAADVVLGSTGTGSGSGAFAGLYGGFKAIAPREGQATGEAFARDFAMGSGTTSMSRGMKQARSVLGNEPSGVFHIRSGSGGRVFTPKRVYMRTRGRSRGTLTTRKGKTTASIRGRTSGHKVLNLQALAVTYALAYRESSRGARAAQFLPKRYRRILVRKTGGTYRGGNMVGVNSVDGARMHEHRQVLIQNKGGRIIGDLVMRLGGAKSFARIRGFIGDSQRHPGILPRAVMGVSIDREMYLLRRDLKEALRK